MVKRNLGVGRPLTAGGVSSLVRGGPGYFRLFLRVDAAVGVRARAAIASADWCEAGDGGAEVASEDRLGARSVAIRRDTASRRPRASPCRSRGGAGVAHVTDERADRGGEVLEVALALLAESGRRSSPGAEPVEPFQRPVEDPGRLLEQLRVRAGFSLPVERSRLGSSITNRLASAPEESENCGSSLVRIMNRVGSRPVHGSRYLRSTVIVSSPEIYSSRSTATMLSALAPSRASEIDGERPPDERLQTEVLW